MCDYDVNICKIILYIGSIFFMYIFLEWYIIKLPQELDTLNNNRIIEQENKIRILEEVLSNININVNGRINNRVQMSGYLYEYEENI